MNKRHWPLLLGAVGWFGVMFLALWVRLWGVAGHHISTSRSFAESETEQIHQMKNNPRKTIRGQGWKKATNISLAKYRTISSSVLKVLTKDVMRFSDVVRGVEKRVKSFPGSVAWYTLSCLRELESQKKIVRHKAKPVGYSKK